MLMSHKTMSLRLSIVNKTYLCLESRFNQGADQKPKPTPKCHSFNR
jgi:hypothetical protein